MKIKIVYGFCTDGDYGLDNPESFHCIGKDVEVNDNYYDYIGQVDFESDEDWRCKLEAQCFLKKLLCSGLHISYTHHYILKDFYDLIDCLLKFIVKHESGIIVKSLSGNYDGTFISVEYINEQEDQYEG